MDHPTPVQSPILNIDVVSDVMCPWCFIGKRRLEKALAEAPEIAAEVRWRPFLLDAAIPAGGMDRSEYLTNKFGKAAIGEMHRQIAETGAAEGIAFAFDKITRAPNTLDAHRVIRWATTTGHQHEVVEALFSAYFVEGRDIGNSKTLTEIAEAAGMDREVVARLLAGDADRDAVKDEIRIAGEMGIAGVPCFIFGRKYAVSGAQAPEILAGAMRQALIELGNDTPDS